MNPVKKFAEEMIKAIPTKCGLKEMYHSVEGVEIVAKNVNMQGTYMWRRFAPVRGEYILSSVYLVNGKFFYYDKLASLNAQCDECVLGDLSKLDTLNALKAKTRDIEQQALSNGVNCGGLYFPMIRDVRIYGNQIGKLYVKTYSKKDAYMVNVSKIIDTHYDVFY